VADQIVFHQVHICRHELFHGLRWYADLFWELEHLGRERERDGVDLEAVMQDWPRRFFTATAWAAGRLGRPVDDLAGGSPGRGSRLDRWVLGSVARRHLAMRQWWLPHWYYSPTLDSWIRNESGSLALAVMRTITRRLSRRLAHALRGGRRPVEV
jgi:hypothetical protein